MPEHRIVAVTADAMATPDLTIVPPGWPFDALGHPYEATAGRQIVRIGSGGAVTMVLDHLDGAEGMATSRDGSVLLIAELGKQRISQCRIEADGGLPAIAHSRIRPV